MCLFISRCLWANSDISDDFLGGRTQELDLGSDASDGEVVQPKFKSKKSKQASKPTKIIPDGSSSDSSSEEDEDEGPVTLSNMEARSRALDVRAAKEAQLDAEELQLAEQIGAEDDDELDENDGDGASEAEGEDEGAFVLPIAAEREEEKRLGGPDVHVVQRRMRECVRILGKWKKLGEKTGR